MRFLQWNNTQREHYLLTLTKRKFFMTDLSKKENINETISSAADSFQVGNNLTQKELGDDAKLYVAKNDAVYKGELIGVTSMHLIQKTSDKVAFAHFIPKDAKDIKNISGSLENKTSIVVSYSEKGIQEFHSLDKYDDIKKEKNSRAFKASYAELKDEAFDQLGSSAQVFVAKKDSEYQGEILAETDKQFLQRVGKTSAVVHSKQFNNKDQIVIGERANVTYDKDGKQSMDLKKSLTVSEESER